MVAPGKGGGTQSDGLIRGRTALFACLCALASFNAFADPAAQAFQTWFLAVAGGCLACIVVELSAGNGTWLARLLVGAGFAILDGFVYLALLAMLIQVAPLFVMMLVPWVIPAARLWWLKGKRPPAHP